MESDPYYTIGKIYLGPIYVEFVKWIYQYASQNNFSKMYFLMRDGQIFYEVYQKCQFPIKAELFHISKISYFKAIIEQPQDFTSFAKRYINKITIKTLLGYFDIDYSDSNEKLSESSLANIVDNFFPQIKRYSQQYWTKLYKYLIRHELQTTNKMLIIDAGWGLTTQYLLDKVLKRSTDLSGIKITGLYLLRSGINLYNLPVNHLDAHGFLSNKLSLQSHLNLIFDQEIKETINDRFWFEKLSLQIEIISRFGLGGTVSFNDNGQPILEDDQIPKAQLLLIQQIHQGIFDHPRDQFYDKHQLQAFLNYYLKISNPLFKDWVYDFGIPSRIEKFIS